MPRFIAGTLFGLIIGLAFGAHAAEILENGYLIGWTVAKDGTELCSDPFIWADLKEIECD